MHVERPQEIKRVKPAPFLHELKIDNNLETKRERNNCDWIRHGVITSDESGYSKYLEGNYCNGPSPCGTTFSPAPSITYCQTREDKFEVSENSNN